jgi:hypothetical protein
MRTKKIRGKEESKNARGQNTNSAGSDPILAGLGPPRRSMGSLPAVTQEA